MPVTTRLKFSTLAAARHLLASALVATMAGLLVFQVWYPAPYSDLAAGASLFTLLISVDVVCGPLLTLILFSLSKPRKELVQDLALVVVVQLCALLYGLSAVWLARPLFLVAEVDRFKVISAASLRERERSDVPAALAPRFLEGPRMVSVQGPTDQDIKLSNIRGVLEGEPDLGERPQYYVPYDQAAGAALYARAKPPGRFLEKFPQQKTRFDTLAAESGASATSLRYVPVIALQDWVALMDPSGRVIGFIKGDGF